MFGTDIPVEPKDEALVLACRRGDNAAWELLVQRYQRLIWSIARQSGLSEDLCADVFQQVFVTLAEKLDQIERPASIGSWLVTTARRETWRVSRRERAISSLPNDEETADSLPDESLLPDEVILRLESQHMIRAAVASLDDRCGVLLRLLFFRAEPPPYAELAAILGTSEGSIGPTRARCLQKLRRLLDSAGF
jgi:RNA polymerase sigma factor (sigma-70 family)